MKLRAFLLFFVLVLAIFFGRGNNGHHSLADYSGSTSKLEQTASSDNQATASDTSVPAKVLKVLEIIRRTGEAPEGYVGGRVFQNREHRLPQNGDYREFDVDPHHGGRNAERIVMDWSTKKAWYTDDHYQTFTPLP